LHIEMRVRDLMSRGLSENEARAEAERRFGGLDRARATLQRSAEHRERTMSVGEWLEGWRQDIRYSSRSLRRDPLLALVVVLTLGLGIGANATMFGIVDQLLLRGPAHIEAPERVQRVYVTWQPLTGGGEPTTSARLGYVASAVLREGTDVFEDIAVYNHRAVRLGRGESAEEATVGYATSNLFPLLGVRPALGRFFGPEDDRPDAPERVAVLEYAHWQAHHGATADVLGRTLVVNDEEFTIIGVAPRGFTGPELQRTKVWLPFSAMRQPRADWQTTLNATWLNVLTRLRPDVSLDQAEAASTATLRAAAIGAERPGADRLNVTLRPATYTVAGLEPPEIAVSRWLTGVSLIVLLVACANVVNLLIARALRRQRELAVRLSLGVSRGRLARLLLSESMLLAIAGCVVAALLAGWGGQFLHGVLLPDVAWDAPLNTRVLVFSAAVALLTGILVGLIPGIQAARHDVTGMLKAAGRQVGLQRSRLRGVLTVAQAALAVVLLIGATLFVRSLWNVQALDVGVDATRVLAVWPNFHGLSDLPEAEREAAQARRAAFWEQALERLGTRSDVISASRAVSTPLQGTMTIPLRVPGLDSLPRLPGGGPFAIGVDGGYFETVGTRIIIGRAIDAADVRLQDPVVVINEPMAQALWPGEDPLDRCIHIGGPERACFRVVGVAQETRRWRLVEEPAMQYYVPIGLADMSGGMLLVRPATRRDGGHPRTARCAPRHGAWPELPAHRCAECDAGPAHAPVAARFHHVPGIRRARPCHRRYWPLLGHRVQRRAEARRTGCQARDGRTLTRHRRHDRAPGRRTRAARNCCGWPVGGPRGPVYRAAVV
jgi:predicted permease